MRFLYILLPLLCGLLAHALPPFLNVRRWIDAPVPGAVLVSEADPDLPSVTKPDAWETGYPLHTTALLAGAAAETPKPRAVAAGPGPAVAPAAANAKAAAIHPHIRPEVHRQKAQYKAPAPAGAAAAAAAGAGAANMRIQKHPNPAAIEAKHDSIKTVQHAPAVEKKPIHKPVVAELEHEHEHEHKLLQHTDPKPAEKSRKIKSKEKLAAGPAHRKAKTSQDVPVPLRKSPAFLAEARLAGNAHKA